MFKLRLATGLLLPLVSTTVRAHGNDEVLFVGKPSHAKDATRTVTVTMFDSMRHRAADDRCQERRGDPLRFQERRKIRHEMTLSSKQELKEHADMMRTMPNMMDHDATSVTVEPWQTGDLMWRFSLAGSFDFACLQPGHFWVGMKGTITVK